MNPLANTNTVSAIALPAVKCPKSRRIQARRRRYQGQATVEFALILLPFLAILFAIVDYAQIYFYSNSLQNGLREACRFATTGRVIPVTTSPFYETNSGGVVVLKAIGGDGHAEASRNECIRYWFLTNCVIRLPLSNITIVSAPTLPGVPPNLVTNGGAVALRLSDGAAPNKGPGAATDYVQITAIYPISTITPLFTYLSGGYNRSSGASMNTYVVRVSAIVKNEPAYLNFLHTNVYSDEP